MRLFYIVMISYAFLGCDSFKEEVDAIPNRVGELVLIQGFLSPEVSIIRVRVSKAVSYFEQPILLDDLQEDIRELLTIREATVTIIDEDQNEIDLEYSEDSFAYEVLATEYPIVPGKKYRLIVKTEEKEFLAECTIPMKIIEDIIVDTTVLNSDFFTGSLNFEFEDIIGEPNFYIVGAKYLRLSDNRSFNSDFREERFISDVNEDGVSLFAKGSISGLDGPIEVIAQVANTDENIYKLLRAVFVNNSDQDENPFFEPIIPPNNIEGEGGYGVFGGFRLYEKQVEF